MPIRTSLTRFFATFIAVLFIAPVTTMAGTTEKSGSSFRYYERVENPGTRSAGVRGVLLYKGNYLQPLPGAIKTPIGSFHYIESPILFEPQGWFPVQDLAIVQTTNSIDAAAAQTPQAGLAARQFGRLRMRLIGNIARQTR